MDIQPLHHNDLKLIPDLLPPDWERAIPVIQLYTTLDFCFPIKVLIDEKMVGIGSTIIHKDIAWLAHITVHPEHRNQGIGQLITQVLVDIAISNKCDTIYLIATELGEPVYKKIGFETETTYFFFKMEQLIESSSHDEHIVPYSSEHEKQILRLDRQVSDEERGFHLKQHLSSGFVYILDNRVEGYYLPTLSDGVIIAETTRAGQTLMQLRLSMKDIAAFPIDNESATLLIQQHSFTQIARQKRMRLGKKRNWQPTNIYNRIGGNLG